MIHFGRRGQVTAFVIIAILLIIAAVLIFSFPNLLKQTEKPAPIIPELRTVSNSIQRDVDACVQEVGADAIYLSAFQGGYVTPNEESIPTSYSYYNVWYKNGSKMPEISVVEEEMSSYVDIVLSDCTDFSDYEEMGFNITKGNVETKTTVGPSKINFVVNYPITIQKGAQQIKINEFKKSLPSDYLGLYNSASQIVDYLKKDDRKIDIAFLNDLDYPINIFYYDENTLVYSLIGKEKLKEEPLVFMFAEVTDNEPYNSAPIAEPISDQVCFVDQPCFYKIEASDPEGSMVSFDDDSVLFDVDENSGIVSFTPSEIDMGTHLVNIVVSDGAKEAYKSFYITVKNA